MNHSHFIIKTEEGSSIAIIERDSSSHLFTEKQYESIKYAIAEELGLSPKDIVDILLNQNDQANVYDEIEIQIGVFEEQPYTVKYNFFLQPTWLY